MRCCCPTVGSLSTDQVGKRLTGLTGPVIMHTLKQQTEKTMYSCKSVMAGWQTCVSSTGELIGPVFRKVTDLWLWQRDTLYTAVDSK